MKGLVAYIALDSISRNCTWEQVEEFLNRQTYNDTLKKIMKYYYQVVDNDPVLFFKATRYNGGIIEFKTHPNFIKMLTNRAIRANSPNWFLDYELLKSDIIAHIKILDTLRRHNPSSKMQSDLMIANCEIIDTIKGKTIPTCKDLSLLHQTILSYDIKRDLILEAEIGKCFQFQINLGWPRRIKAVWSPYTMIDSTGKPWLEKDKEYIVFLDYILVCEDSLNLYFDVRPTDSWSVCFWIYPINENIVYDPDDDFGFGTGLTPDEFKASLRNRIYEIKNY